MCRIIRVAQDARQNWDISGTPRSRLAGLPNKFIDGMVDKSRQHARHNATMPEGYTQNTRECIVVDVAGSNY